MRKSVSGLVVAALLALVVAVPAGATTAINGGNDVIYRASLDSSSNFVIVDANNPISGADSLTSWSFWAGAAGGVRLVVVRDDGVTVKVVGQSPEVTLVTTGAPVTTALNPAIEVQPGDEVGLYFSSAGVVPFDGTNSGGTSGTVLYTANGYGLPAIDATLNFAGAVDRTYSVSVSGVAFFDFAGFFAPVYNDAVNSVKAGSAIPMKFSLGGCQGLDIVAAGYPKSAPPRATTLRRSKNSEAR